MTGILLRGIKDAGIHRKIDVRIQREDGYQQAKVNVLEQILPSWSPKPRPANTLIWAFYLHNFLLFKSCWLCNRTAPTEQYNSQAI
jgi:hypothetical protein